MPRILRSLEHRGPDYAGRKYFQLGQCAFVHARLAILDLSATGHQPMSTSHGRYWLSYNGELYNYQELRDELSREGVSHGGISVGGNPSRGDGQTAVAQRASQRPSVQESRWQSNTDSEVILRAYAQWGEDCVRRFRGMFAFAIWDEQEKELFLARDPYGIKPLYYYSTHNTFLFASETRALLASGLVPRKLCRHGLASYLQFGSVQDPLTIIENVHSLLPGHCLIVRFQDGRLDSEMSKYSTSLCAQSGNLEISSRAAAVVHLRSILEDSVRAHLVSDVPVAAFLSGGIDSSAIVGLMSLVSSAKPRTFNVSFDEASFSERSYANIIARKFGTEHENIRLTEDTLVDLLLEALAVMDQPTMDGINTYVVSKAVRDTGIKVALSGLGGDELFAGYPGFRRAMQLNRITAVPSLVRKVGSQAGRVFTNGSVRHRKFWDLLESDCSPYAAYNISRQVFSPEEIISLMGESVRGEELVAKGELPRASRLTHLDSSSLLHGPFSMRHEDIINQVSRLELHGYMVNTLLRDTDQMSMAHAIEVRVPFVDREVIDFVMALPGEWKIDGGRPKPLLLDALGDLLPEEIWRRPKMGFTLPFERWMRSALQTEIESTLFVEENLARVTIEPNYARSVWQSFKANPQRQPWSRPWSLYVLAKWCALNDVRL